jgi:hypothetical protein
MKSDKFRLLFLTTLFIGFALSQVKGQTITITSPVTSGSYCAGANIYTWAPATPVTAFSPSALASSSSDNILPIELIRFSASCSSRDVKIEWITATEHNCDYFEIEKSMDGLSWLPIGKVQSKGESLTIRNYYLIDDAVTKDIAYYRLSQADKNGIKKQYDLIWNICSGREENGFLIFPNPSTDEFQFSMNVNAEKDGLITVTNALGEICATRSITLKKGSNIFPFNLV